MLIHHIGTVDLLILFYITSRSDLRFGSRTNYTYNRRISSVIYSLAIRTQCALHPKLKSFDLTLGKYSLSIHLILPHLIHNTQDLLPE